MEIQYSRDSSSSRNSETRIVNRSRANPRPSPCRQLCTLSRQVVAMLRRSVVREFCVEMFLTWSAHKLFLRATWHDHTAAGNSIGRFVEVIALIRTISTTRLGKQPCNNDRPDRRPAIGGSRICTWYYVSLAPSSRELLPCLPCSPPVYAVFLGPHRKHRAHTVTYSTECLSCDPASSKRIARFQKSEFPEWGAMLETLNNQRTAESGFGDETL